MNHVLMLLKGLSVLIGAAGVVLLIRSPTRRFQALFWIALGLGLALVAYRPGFGSHPAATATALKMRMATGVVSFMVLMITLEAVRRTAMLERYAVLWVFTGLVIFAVALHPDTIAWLVRLTGMHYTSAIMVVVFTFLLLVAFDFSMALSRHQDKQKQMAQRIALLEKRLEQVEPPAGAAPPEAKPRSS